MKSIMLMLASIFLSYFAMAQINYQPQTIKVKGSAEKLVEPNEVHLIVNLKEINERNNQLSIVQARDEFLAICNAQLVETENIKLSNANSRLEQKLSLWRKARTEVVQRESYDVKFTDMEKLLSVIETLDKPFVESIDFGEQTHTKITTYRKDVKEDAAKAAIEKATYLAKASGREIGKVIFIEEVDDRYTGATNQFANKMRYEKEKYGGSAKVNFGFSPIGLRYEVLVICELK